MGVNGYYERKAQFLRANPGGIFPGSTEEQRLHQGWRDTEEVTKLRTQVENLKEELANLRNLPNPREDNFRIELAKEINGYIVLEVAYPDCTNFEGKKLMVYEKGVTLLDIINQKSLDPHFCDSSNYYSPIARFIPNELGWELAVRMCWGTD